MKKLLWVTCFAISFLFASAQKDELEVHGTSPDLYLEHTVTPKENWYSVGRLFNVSPHVLATYNNTTLSDGLNIGQLLKIPLRDDNFSQNGSKASGEVFVPVYHVVQEKEWLYRVSVNHNKVPVETLEKWNHVTNDEVRPGMRLVVGYLTVKRDQSALASQGKNNIAFATTTPVVTENHNDAVAKNDTQVPVETKPNAPASTANTPVTEKKSEPVATTREMATQSTYEENKASAVTPGNGGYFHRFYANTGKDMHGDAATFKSTSGWKDGKYYGLMNDVPVGTIVKVTFPSTQKSVYIKILGQLPDMKESAGLLIRLSDAAAAELGAGNSGFYVEISY